MFWYFEERFGCRVRTEFAFCLIAFDSGERLRFKHAIASLRHGSRIYTALVCNIWNHRQDQKSLMQLGASRRMVAKWKIRNIDHQNGNDNGGEVGSTTTRCRQ